MVSFGFFDEQCLWAFFTPLPYIPIKTKTKTTQFASKERKKPMYKPLNC